MRTASSALTILAAAGLWATGCSSIGPKTIPRDRSDYSGSISESWKRQTLLNIVKLRYVDPPIFVDVGQIISGYSLETALTAGGTFPENGAFGGTTGSVGGSMRFTDRPTITYIPLTGLKFVKALMTPLTPEGVLYTVQSGWPVNSVFFACVSVMNGLKNQETSIAGVTPPDPRFLRVLELLRKVQTSGAVGFRVQQDEKKQESSLLTFRSKDVSEETLADIKEIRQLLNLDPDVSEFKIAFGATAVNDKELALQTRSMLHIMTTMASQVEAPPEDVTQGKTIAGFDSSTGATEQTRLINIHSSKSKPTDPYAVVYYRNHWFWIDDTDLKSKRSFAFMMMLFTLADTGEKEAAPVVTIPAQ